MGNLNEACLANTKDIFHHWVENDAGGQTCKFCLTVLVEDKEPERPTWPSVWMQVAKTIALRSIDPALKVGAIVVSSNNTQMLSVGYNGMWKGGPNHVESLERGKSGTVHAEVNALVKCDYNFARPKHMYVTNSPCKECAKLIVNAEIARVVYEIPYRITDGIDLLKSAGVEVLTLQEAIYQALARR